MLYGGILWQEFSLGGLRCERSATEPFVEKRVHARPRSKAPDFRHCYQSFARLMVVAFAWIVPSQLHSQTNSTGALTGVVVDVSGAAIPGVSIRVTNNDSPEVRSAASDQEGRFGIFLLPPATYHLRAQRSDFEPLTLPDLQVTVTETLRLELRLHPATRVEQTQVAAGSVMLQTDTSALGGLVSRKTITNLPLATRNFAQIAGLSPGVTVGVYNPGELGSGGTANSQVGSSNDGIFVHGSRSYENNWQLDGISASDVMSSGSASGGIPIPNPDTLEQFKMQTGLYDAAFGRTAGANVSIITRTGTSEYHGAIFEFLRNNILNANDYFLNKTGQPRPDLKQNQFGFALGGPIQNDNLLFFVSYQGTRQINGLAAGQARIGCSASLSEPPITNDRSPQALGQLFGGMSGAKGGVPILADGSNINAVALALLNFKLSDGSFLIPTPQTVDRSKSFDAQGFSALTQACSYNENQGLGNLDYTISPKSRIDSRFFLSDSNQLITFPGSGLNPSGNIRGFESPVTSDFVVFSAAHTYVISNTLLNEARIGFVRNSTESGSEAPFAWSQVGVAEGEMNENNELPDLTILGSVSMASAFARTYTQNTFSLSDMISWLRGAHAMKFGASLARLQEHFDISGLGSSVQFLSWPDFLLGLDANDNQTGSFSNVYKSSDIFGLVNRDFRAWEGSAFMQDDYRIQRGLNLNLGVRYDRLGQFGDKLGRNSSFDITSANANPPPGGSLDGYVVASNFPGTPPPGVIRSDNTLGTYGKGQNSVAPRIGFAWQVPKATHLAVRGGYGLYYSRPTGQASAQSITGAPFSVFRTSTGQANAGATFQTPFSQPFPTPSSFPLFVPYSPSTKSSVNTLSPTFRPAVVQELSFNLQAELRRGWLLEVGYVGARGTHSQRFRSLNQALDASYKNPIRGVTSNAIANIGLRVPVPGIPADSLQEMESEGSYWYKGLEASLTKRSAHGFQFLASYTFSKTLDTDGANINGTSSGSVLTLGNQNSEAQRWGRASFDRRHRFVFSETWTIRSPSPRFQRVLFGGWDLAAVATIQSGNALTIADTNADNVFGISEDRAALTGTCTKSQFVNRGGVESKLGGYFNASCFTNPPIIGSDGIGTAFGNTATGLVDGPGQANLDLAVSKTVALSWPHEGGTFQFRAEFFNALNHPQFANPDANLTSPTFGLISSTAVSARVGQLALRFNF